VNEVNSVAADSPWEGPVWNFLVRPITAWRPDPPAGARFVETDRQLSWQAGKGNFFHTIYFGTSADAVNNSTATSVMISDAQYDPGPLQPGTSYFWRVDEFVPPGAVRGELWQHDGGGRRFQAEYFDNRTSRANRATRTDPDQFRLGRRDRAGTQLAGRQNPRRRVLRPLDGRA
jgi:hypothetical protein